MSYKIRVAFFLGSFAMSFLFISFLTLGKYPNWWEWVVPEQSPMTWFESILLMGSAFFAFSISIICFIAGQNTAEGGKWLFVSFAFFYLSLDERFALHERVRDSLFAPKGTILFPFVWTAPGDFILPLMTVLAFFFLPFLRKLFAPNPTAKRLFLAGFVTAVFAVFLDSLNPHSWSLPAQRLEQYLEEIVETIAMLLFLNGIFFIFNSKLSRLRFHESSKD